MSHFKDFSSISTVHASVTGFGLQKACVVPREVIDIGTDPNAIATVVRHVRQSQTQSEDVVVVFGCQPRDGISLYRAMGAVEVLRQNPHARVILCGSNPSAVEAAVMGAVLAAQNISPERFILEAWSRGTCENAAFAAPAVAALGARRVHLVTNGYHMGRAHALMGASMAQLRAHASELGFDPNQLAPEIRQVAVDHDNEPLATRLARETRCLERPPCTGMTPQQCDEALLKRGLVGTAFDAFMSSGHCLCGCEGKHEAKTG